MKIENSYWVIHCCKLCESYCEGPFSWEEAKQEIQDILDTEGTNEEVFCFCGQQIPVKITYNLNLGKVKNENGK